MALTNDYDSLWNSVYSVPSYTADGGVISVSTLDSSDCSGTSSSPSEMLAGPALPASASSVSSFPSLDPGRFPNEGGFGPAVPIVGNLGPAPTPTSTFNAPPSSSDTAPKRDSASRTSASRSTASLAARDKPERVRDPANNFMEFKSDLARRLREDPGGTHRLWEVYRVVKEYGGDGRDVSRLAAAVWSRLSKEKRNDWKKQAEKRRLHHERH